MYLLLCINSLNMVLRYCPLPVLIPRQFIRLQIQDNSTKMHNVYSPAALHEIRIMSALPATLKQQDSWWPAYHPFGQPYWEPATLRKIFLFPTNPPFLKAHWKPATLRKIFVFPTNPQLLTAHWQPATLRRRLLIPQQVFLQTRSLGVSHPSKNIVIPHQPFIP